ncbi:MAG TPA: hypothetical protein VED40_06320 [Azospirillaceae bacterium]|nr:hypothetical protein [Azospirillaceae bacterium]
MRFILPAAALLLLAACQTTAEAPKAASAAAEPAKQAAQAPEATKPAAKEGCNANTGTRLAKSSC